MIETGQAAIRVRHGGGGRPVLLLHGFPQTHLMWHKIAPRLAREFTVVAADLRGYGGSSKPGTTADHEPYSKRAMARDMVAVMERLGFDRFSVVDTTVADASPTGLRWIIRRAWSGWRCSTSCR
jgi:haloacetate dehalogenase